VFWYVNSKVTTEILYSKRDKNILYVQKRNLSHIFATSVLEINISGGEFAVPRKLPVNGDRFKYSAAVFIRRILHYWG